MITIDYKGRTFAAGKRVCISQAIDRFPHFIFPRDTRGTIEEIQESGKDSYVVFVRPDEPLDILKEWEGLLELYHGPAFWDDDYAYSDLDAMYLYADGEGDDD